MRDLSAARRLPLDNLALTAAAVSMAPLPPAARFILRARPAGQVAAAPALGLTLPAVPCRASTAGARAALWMGPDEWLILVPEADAAALPGAVAAALGAEPHSLVEVSHRQAALLLTGPEAATVLNTGCALDLDPAAFPVGMCTRTLLGKADIVLWRTADHSFHVEAWRSFLPYVWGFLEEAAREFTA